MPNKGKMPNVTKAQDLLEYLKTEKTFSIKAPIDVENIVNCLGVKLEYYFDFESETVGSITRSGSDYVIKINEIHNHYEPRKRFTIAHELGHLFLHLNGVDGVSFDDTEKTMSRTESYWDIKESQANSFAAQLLMPKKLIVGKGKELLTELQKKGKTITADEFVEAMSTIFNVSSPAMRYRLITLKILKK